MLLIDKYILKFCGLLDNLSAGIDKLFAPRCKCKKKNSKRTYKKEKDHGTDISFENEINHGK
jgi:hypothetical protein|tara:strand:+ start:135 stop:320 length:186 start_codon:yes stop_codon:yes gene_type:complete